MSLCPSWFTDKHEMKMWKLYPWVTTRSLLMWLVLEWDKRLYCYGYGVPCRVRDTQILSAMLPCSDIHMMRRDSGRPISLMFCLHEWQQYWECDKEWSNELIMSFLPITFEVSDSVNGWLHCEWEVVHLVTSLSVWLYHVVKIEHLDQLWKLACVSVHWWIKFVMWFKYTRRWYGKIVCTQLLCIIFDILPGYIESRSFVGRLVHRVMIFKMSSFCLFVKNQFQQIDMISGRWYMIKLASATWIRGVVHLLLSTELRICNVKQCPNAC